MLLQLRRDTYTRLTPVQRLQVARHPNRPTFLDIILNISDSFVELHGDRAGLDDPAIVCGLASIDGISFMAIGHQKGRNTKVLASSFSCKASEANLDSPICHKLVQVLSTDVNASLFPCRNESLEEKF